MNKIKYYIGIIMLFACFYTAYSAFASGVEIMFENEKYEWVNGVSDGKIRAVAYVAPEKSGEIKFVQAVYSGNVLKAVSFEIAELSSDGTVLRSDFLDTLSSDCVRVFAFDSNLKPLFKAVTPSDSAPVITNAVFEIGDETFDGDVNPVSRTVTVNYPCYIASSYGVDTVAGVVESHMKSLENVRVSFDVINGETPFENGSLVDFSSPEKVVILADDGTPYEYTFRANLVYQSRNYDCENAVIETEATASNWNKAYRIGAPKYITSEANRSDGTWLLNKNSVYATSIRSENGNDYINISKSAGETYGLWTSGSGSSSDVFSTEFEFRLNHASQNEDIITVWSSNTDKIIITTKGMREDCFTLAHSSNNGNDLKISDSLFLEYGKWHKLRFVFKKGDELSYPVSGGYITEMYVNGKLADVFSHSLSAEELEKAGSFNYVASAAEPSGSSNTLPYPSYPYVAFETNDDADVDIDIDNLSSNRKPIGNETEIYYAKVTVGGKTYTADVNPVKKEITADIYDELSAEQLKNAKVTISSRANVSPKANGTLAVDLTSPMTYTITATDGKFKENYEFRIERSKLMRNYDSEGATIDSKGVPGRLASEKGHLSNWLVNKKTNSSAPGANASVSISNYNNNDYITLYKKDTTNGLYFSSMLDSSVFDASASPSGIFADKFAMEIKFNIAGADSSDPDYFGSISSSKEDRIIFSKKNMPEGKFCFAASNVNGTGVYDLDESPELSFGKWYTLRYIFRRYAPVDYTNADWYGVEIYLDGKYITELHRHDPSIKENGWQYLYSGRFNNSENYAQLFVSMFTGFTGTFRLDDFNITYMENWNGAGSSVVYESDYPVAVVTDENSNKAECRLILDSSKNEARVYMPFTTSVEEQRNMEGRGAPKPYVDAANTVLVFPDDYEVTYNGKKCGGVVPCSFGETDVLEVNGIGYSLRCVPSELSLRYDAEGAEVSSGVLKALSGGSESAGNFGYGVMKSSDASAISVADAGEYGDVIRLSSESASADVEFSDTQPSDSKAAVSNCEIVSSFKLCVENAESNGEFAAITTFGATGFGLSKVSDSEFEISGSGESFKMGQWYNIDAVFVKSDDGCRVDLYVDSLCVGSESVAESDGNLNTTQQLKLILTSNNNAAVMLDDIEIQAVNDVLKDKTVIHLIGDSICTYYGGSTTLRGWGQYLMNEFDSSCLTLNHAVGGYNTNIFLKGSDVEKTRTRERWTSIKSRMKDGDYLIVALAWNEANANNGTTKAQYRENILKMVNEAKSLGVTPLLVTPHMWVKDTLPHELENARLDYAECIRDICVENDIECLDLNSELVEEWSGTDAQTIYATYFYSDGLHMNGAGARLLSDKILSQIKSGNSSLKSYLK